MSVKFCPVFVGIFDETDFPGPLLETEDFHFVPVQKPGYQLFSCPSTVADVLAS